MRPKPNISRQIGIVLGVFVICCLIVYMGMVVEALATGHRWSDTYIARLIVERYHLRQRQQAERDAMSQNQ
jgi:hypothetical protein